MELLQACSFRWVVNVLKIRCHDVVQGFAKVRFKLLAGLAVLTFIGKDVLQCGMRNL